MSKEKISDDTQEKITDDTQKKKRTRRSPTVTRNRIKDMIAKGIIVKDSVLENTLMLNVSYTDTDETGESYDAMEQINLIELLGITTDMIDNIFNSEQRRIEFDNAKKVAIQALKTSGFSDEAITKILAKGN